MKDRTVNMEIKKTVHDGIIVLTLMYVSYIELHRIFRPDHTDPGVHTR